jgi:hypothetical protein
MKLPLYSLLFAAVISAASAQAPTKPVPDLSNFTSAQLQACFSNPSICGTEDETQIANELASRLPQFTLNQLLACFDDWKICGADSYSLSDEVRERKQTQRLIDRYWKEKKTSIRSGIVQSLYPLHTAAVHAFMRKVFQGQKGSDGELYWPANYLAKQCDSGALHWLSTRKGRSQSCMQYTGTIELFGHCHYRKAIPYLITYSLGDACLNIVGAGEEDLRGMFPHSPKEFDSIEKMQDYYCRRARHDGFKLACRTK